MWGILALSKHLGGYPGQVQERESSPAGCRPKHGFPRLLKRTIKRANPGQHMAAAFRKCGLFPVNPSKAMERIPSRDIDAPETIRELLNPTQGEKLDQLRGTGGKEKKAKGRGQKIKVVPGKLYSAPVVDSWENDEEEGLDKVEVNSEEQMAVQRKGTRKAQSKD